MDRLLTLTLLLFLSLSLFAQADRLEDLSDDFFQEYASQGKVHYKRLSTDPSTLDQLVQLYGMEQFQISEEEKKAFYINAYNLFVIDALVKEYPTQSPQQIAGFFTAKNFLLQGERVSLNQIEKEKLDPKADPRLHFALICGALGCPPIANFSYRTKGLDSLLEVQSFNALNNSNFVRYNSTTNQLSLSEIFKWYQTDFKTVSKTAIEYVNRYRELKIPEDAELSYYTYDWTINSVESIRAETANIASADRAKSNLELFTPSALFQWGEFEINSFNSLYYQNSARNSDGEEFDLADSQSFFNALIQFTTGLPNSRRINVGLDVNITTARYGPQEEDPTDFFNDETATFKKTIVSSIGPRIKVVPLKSVPRLSIQSTFLFPIAQNQESPVFIFHDRYTWFTQLFFDQSIGDKFQIFTEADLLYRFNRNSTNEEDFFRVPLSAFLSYFPTSNSTIYVFSQYSPRYENVMLDSERSEFGLSSWFTQLGVGGKYQITPKLGVEVSYADFILSKNDGAGYAVNFGLRYIYR